MPKSLLSLRKSAVAGTVAATPSSTMSRIQAICPVSMRPAYFGSRRIAPIAEASRSDGRGARPAVEQLRSAQNGTDREIEEPAQVSTPLVSAFVTQVIAQFDNTSPAPTAGAAHAYEVADDLDRWKIRWISQSV